MRGAVILAATLAARLGSLLALAGIGRLLEEILDELRAERAPAGVYGEYGPTIDELRALFDGPPDPF